MAVQGTIYYKAVWADPPGRPCTGNQGYRPRPRLFSEAQKSRTVVNRDALVHSLTCAAGLRVAALELYC